MEIAVNEYLGRVDLYARGWTDGSIAALLQPDEQWDPCIVASLEQSDVWRQWRKDINVSTRKLKRQRYYEKTKRILLAKAKTVQIHVSLRLRHDIETATIKVRKNMGLSVLEYENTGKIPEKWLLNYVRHELTSYEKGLGQLRDLNTARKRDMELAYYVLRYRVIVQIGNNYDYLRCACIEELRKMPLSAICEELPTEKKRVTELYTNNWF